MRTRPLTLFGILTLTYIAACSSANDDPLGTDVGEKRVDPEGQENLADLEILPPKKRSVDLSAYRITVDDKVVEVGKIQHLVAGQHTIEITNVGRNARTGVAELTLPTGTHRKYALSELSVQVDAKKIATDFAPHPRAFVDMKDIEVTDRKTAPVRELTTAAEKVSAAYTAPNFAASEFLPHETIALAEGASVDWELSPPESRTTIKYTLEKPEFPEAANDCKLDMVASLWIGYGQQNDERTWLTAKPGTATAVRFYPVANLRYVFSAHGEEQSLIDLPKGKTVALPIGRIDVNDVLVKASNGTSKRVEGTYWVERTTDTGTKTWVALRTSNASGGCDSLPGTPTKTGLYLPAGSYTVQTRFATKDNEETHTASITLP